MKEDTEFQEIGRRLPYKVPAGFFEQVSEKTLRKAKQREQNHRKMVITLRSFAIAASLSGIVLLGYFMLQPVKPETKLIVQDKHTEIKESPRHVEVIVKPITIPQTKKVEPVKSIAEEKKVEPVKSIAEEKKLEEKKPEEKQLEETKTEEISEVLTDLSDDELLQLAAMYKSDLFIDESQH